MLHGIRCIQSGCFGPCCIKSNAFTQDAFVLTAWTPLNTIGIHCTKMHWIFCIPWHYMESTAFNRDALGHAAKNPLHSIMLQESTTFNHAAGIYCIQLCCINRLHSLGFHLFTLHGINCTQSRCIKSTAFNQVALGLASWNPLHAIMLHGVHCIQSRCMESTAFNRDAFYQAAWNTLHSITLYRIHCIQLWHTAPRCIQSESTTPHCIESTAFNRDPFSHTAWYALRSIRMHWASLHGLHCIQSRCMESTAFNRDAFGHAA